MKKFLIFGVLVVGLSGCLSNPVPLKGNYEPKNKFYSNKSVDEVWSNIIDYFASTGNKIKLLDKASGFIVAEPVIFEEVTFEKADGTLNNKDAYVAVALSKEEKRVFKNKKYYTTNPLKSSWNIRIKPVDNKTMIKVNLVGTSFAAKYKDTDGTIKTVNPFVASTGNFEKEIFEQIK